MQATCDYCGAPLDCARESPECLGYWRTDLGLYICDPCLLENADDYPDMSPSRRLFALRLRYVRGISMKSMDEVIERARGRMNPDAIVFAERGIHRAVKLFEQRELLAAIEAGQAAWNSVNTLSAAIDLLPGFRTGLKVRAPFKEANETKQATSNQQREHWQQRASEKWADPAHANKSASEIARLIARDGEKPATIRRRIKKLS